MHSKRDQVGIKKREPCVRVITKENERTIVCSFITIDLYVYVCY